MKFFKALFGNKEEKPEEKKKNEEAKNFDVLKYDGVRALRAGQAEYAIRFSLMPCRCRMTLKYTIICRKPTSAPANLLKLMNS